MTFAVRAENLSKTYRIHHDAGGWAKYPTLRDDIARLFTRRGASEELWALRDVSFEAPDGKVLGIIGRNGAGKSTLLKILSRVTEPTSGRVRLRGRVGSLLEVGTGFHPELTGRENIVLSGAILGMSRAEVARKFDEIVAFAEIDKFLDTPVKRYSSGMYMRLAFAVAAHLEPEILVVDEVLAVGDAAFQAKCLTRMGKVADEGRTILFVSHNLAAIERLCHSVLLLEKGEVTRRGPPGEVIAAYLGQEANLALEWRRAAPFPESPHFRRAKLLNADGSPCSQATSSSTLMVEIEFALPVAIKGLMFAMAAKRPMGEWIFSTSPVDVGHAIPDAAGVYTTRVTLPPAIFAPKRFALTFALYDSARQYDLQTDALTFDVVETASLVNLVPGGRVGDLQIRCDWSPIEKSLGQ